MRLRHYLTFDGDPITLDGCDCDEGQPCADARCQMQRDLQERAFLAEYLHDRRVRPVASYAEDMIDAGRGHLLTLDERCAYLMSQR